MRYRSDIDGLRTVAVLPVVFYHLGIPGFPGGYVGVDVFFVISGYLITSLIGEEVKEHRFSIIRFYERRVRRIFPALIVVLIFSAILATRSMFPEMLAKFGASVFATVFFASNILFWRESGYFDLTATEKPLLHTWSLAVEEQFYIFFPLILYAVHRWAKSRWIPWIGGIAALSFALSVYGVYKWPTATFYLAPTRAWELMIGALLALDVVPPAFSRWLREALALFGVVLIACAVFFFSDTTTFPGPGAVAPCFGAALVIYAGRSGSTATGAALSSWPMVRVGLASYSLYLWHWPLIVFAKGFLLHPLTTSDRAVLLVASYLAAEVSLRFVEKPFRRRDGVLRRYPLFAAAAAVMGCLAGFGLLGHLSHGWPSRLPKAVAEVASYQDSHDPRQAQCLASKRHPIPIKDACIYGADVAPTYALWGDSHSIAIIPALARMAKANGQAIKMIGFGGCPSVIGVNRRDEPVCMKHNEQAFNYLRASEEIHTVILVSRYVANLYGRDYASEPDQRRVPLMTGPSGHIMTPEQATSLLARQLPITVQSLLGAGKSVVLIYPIPDPAFNVPTTLAHLAWNGVDLDTVTMPAESYNDWQHDVLAILDGIGPSDRLMRVYPSRTLCDTNRCLVYRDGKPLYRDFTHLSLAGADLIEPIFEPIFRKQAAASDQ